VPRCILEEHLKELCRFVPSYADAAYRLAYISEKHGRKVFFMCRYLNHCDSTDGWYALACLLAKAATTATVHGCRVDYLEALRRSGRQSLKDLIKLTHQGRPERRCDMLLASLQSRGVDLVTLCTSTKAVKPALDADAFKELWELHCFLDEYAAVMCEKNTDGDITARFTADYVRPALLAAAAEQLKDPLALEADPVLKATVVDALRIAVSADAPLDSKVDWREPVPLPPLAEKYSVVRERMSGCYENDAPALAATLMSGGRLGLQGMAAAVAGTEGSWSALQADSARWKVLVTLFPRAGTHPDEFRLDLLRLAVTNGEVFNFFGGQRWWELGHMLETHGSAVANGVAVDALTCFEAQLNSMINLKRCPQFWLSMAEALRLGNNRPKVRVKGTLYERQGCLEMAYGALLQEPKDEAELEMTRACLSMLLSVYRQCQSNGHAVKLDAESAQKRLDELDKLEKKRRDELDKLEKKRLDEQLVGLH
jgi:hypothetical protein